MFLEGMEGVSSFASRIDTALFVIGGINLVIFVGMVIATIYLAMKYRKSKVSKDDIRNIEHHTGLEIAWTVIPIILILIMSYYGFDSLKVVRELPKGEMFEVEGIGMKWKWLHKYPNGKTTEDLYIPVNKNIKVNLTAPNSDILHSYYVPAFRIKQDVEPGNDNYTWFNVEKEGKYVIECAEYCGTGHSRMYANVVAISQDEFDVWYNSDKKTPFDSDEPKGDPNDIKAIEILENNACSSCHSLDTDEVLVGPSLKNIFKRKVKVVENGEAKEIVSDEEYIIKSIVEPDSQIVDGYEEGMMPPYDSDTISSEDMQILVDFFKRNSNK